MMDKTKFRKLLQDRQNHMKRAPYNSDYSLKSYHKGLHLEAGDFVIHSGFAMRELRMANLPPTGKQERIRAFAEFWFPIWDQQDHHNDIKRAHEAAQKEADARWQRWKKYGPPPRYAEMEPDDFDLGTQEEEAAFDAVMGFGCGYRSTLAVLGKPGTRKTQLASLWLRQQMLDDGKQGQFISASALVRDMKSAELIRRYTTVECLVIDDIGSDANDVETLLRVVDTRLNNGLSTVYTSNATPTQLKEIYGARGFSRLMCDAEIVVLNGQDWRIRRDPASRI